MQWLVVGVVPVCVLRRDVDARCVCAPHRVVQVTILEQIMALSAPINTYVAQCCLVHR